MRTLRHYWGRLFSQLDKPSETDASHATGQENLEREISAIISENQALAEEVQRVRTDFERARDEENRKNTDLEQLRQAMELARNEDQLKLSELESFNSNVETARDADNRKILELEKRLAEIESERVQTRDKFNTLEYSLAETSTRLEKSGLQLKDLQLSSVEHAKQIEASLTDASNRLTSTDNHVRELETRLVSDHQAMELARSEDQRKLAELESLNSIFESARDADSRKILELEKAIAEIGTEGHQVRDEVKGLESALVETSTLMRKSDLQIKDLQVSSVEKARHLETSLSDASNRLASTDNHVRELETRLVNDRQDYLKTYQDMQHRFRKQDSRMTWAMSAAGIALLLGIAAAAVLIWDVQRNTTMLSGMSKDIKQLMGSVEVESSIKPTQPEEQQQLDMLLTKPTDTRAVVTGKSTSSTTAISLPEPSAKESISNVDPRHTNFSALDPARTRPPGDMKQPTRVDAKFFFEENSNVPGVVSLPSGVQYRIIKSGSGETPSLSDQIVVSYVGTRLDGTIFSETYSEGEPLTFSMNEVLPGWREVLLEMEAGSEFELYLPPNLTTKGVRKRGKAGFEPNIYLIELLEVVKKDGADSTAPAN